MKVLALDLSMTATGVAALDPSSSPAAWEHRTLKPPTKRAGMSEMAYDQVRYRALAEPLVALLVAHHPDVLAVEVTRHAHQYKHGKRTTKGSEFKAGLFLGIARGWLNGAVHLASAYGAPQPEIVLVESSTAKRAATGNAAARKTAVRGLLAEMLALDLGDWGADEVDALAVGLAVLAERGVSVVGAMQHPPD